MTSRNGYEVQTGAVQQDGAFDRLNSQKIRAILFDLDGTLRENRPASNQVLWEFVAGYGVGLDPEQRRKAAQWTHAYWAQSQELLDDLAAHPEEEDFWVNYARRHLQVLDCPAELTGKLAPLVRLHMNKNYQPEDWVEPRTHVTLKALKDAGFRLGLLTNRTQPCSDQLQQLGLDVYFDMVLVAGEVNAWKPDPRVFQHALERIGATPEETVYIGDNYYADVIGAQRAGIQPVLVDPEGVFPAAKCPVVTEVAELQTLLAIQGVISQ